MENNKIRNVGVFSFIPLALFTAWTIWYIYLLGGFSSDHFALSEITSRNYDILFFTLAVAACAGASVLLFMIWHVWTQTNLAAGQKVVWVLFLTTFGAFAFPVYWYMHFKHDVPHPNNASPLLS